MYICLCEGLTENQIRDVIDEGAGTVKEIQKKCRAGQSCGSCVRKLRTLVSEGDKDNS